MIVSLLLDYRKCRVDTGQVLLAFSINFGCFTELRLRVSISVA